MIRILKEDYGVSLNMRRNVHWRQRKQHVHRWSPCYSVHLVLQLHPEDSIISKLLWSTQMVLNCECYHFFLLFKFLLTLIIKFRDFNLVWKAVHSLTDNLVSSDNFQHLFVSVSQVLQPLQGLCSLSAKYLLPSLPTNSYLFFKTKLNHYIFREAFMRLTEHSHSTLFILLFLHLSDFCHQGVIYWFASCH